MSPGLLQQCAAHDWRFAQAECTRNPATRLLGLCCRIAVAVSCAVWRSEIHKSQKFMWICAWCARTFAMAHTTFARANHAHTHSGRRRCWDVTVCTSKRAHVLTYSPTFIHIQCLRAHTHTHMLSLICMQLCAQIIPKRFCHALCIHCERHATHARNGNGNGLIPIRRGVTAKKTPRQTNNIH